MDFVVLDVKIKADFVAFYRSSDRSIAQRSGIGAGQFFTVLLQDESRRTALTAQVNLCIPSPADIHSENSESQNSHYSRNQSEFFHAADYINALLTNQSHRDPQPPQIFSSCTASSLLG